MGNSCLVPGNTTVNTTKIGAVFLIHSGPPNRAAESKRKRRRSTVAPRNMSMVSTSSENNTSGANSLLSERDRQLIKCCWREHIVAGRKDLFHKTMLFCIEASPKMNEIIACGRYCYRDLTKWPKLNRICQAQFSFFERLIFEYDMDEAKMRVACMKLGEMHANFSQYGLKPHFLDIYQQQLLAIIARFEIADKVETCIAFTHLTSFVIDVMISSYSKKCSDIRFATAARM